MKKFISFVMAGAMVASLVPATAFAAGEVSATAKVVDSLKLTKDEAKDPAIDESTHLGKVPEAQLKITGVDYRADGTTPSLDIEFTLDNAEFKKAGDDLLKLLTIKDSNGVPKTGSDVSSTPGTAAHYETVSADASGEIMVKDTVTLPAATVATSDVKKIPTFKDTVKDVQTQYTELIAAGGTVTVPPVYDSTTQRYTAGTVVNGGTITDLVTLVPKSVTAADQLAAWIAAQTGYTRATGTYVAATGGSAAGYKFTVDGEDIVVTVKDYDKDSVTYKFTGKLAKDQVIALKLESTLTKTGEGTKATVSVDSKAVTADNMVFANVLGQGLNVSVKKTVDLAVDEKVTLDSHGLKIESAVSDFAAGTVITLKLNSGFEFVKNQSPAITVDGSVGATVSRTDDNVLTLTVGAASDEITVKNIQVEATSAKSGAVATITAKSSNVDTGSCEVAKVVDYKVNLSVDADEDVPVIYSGTNVANAGLTDDSEHMSLEVTAKESFPGAWSMRQGFNFNLPDGVYVTGVEIKTADNFFRGGTSPLPSSTAKTAWATAFEDAYQDGDHKNFEFKKRVFDDVNTTLAPDPAELTFELELVADPTFEGDVKLSLEGALLDKQEVTIAKFVKPYTVKAEQNDVIIDYRNTEVKTPIVITEAAEGLWKKDATFKLNIEDDLLTFENDPTFTIDKDSDMKLKDDKADKGTIKFSVKEESDKAASITISDMKLFMSRSIPAGAYDLEISTTMSEAYDRQKLFAPDEETKTVVEWKSGDRPSESSVKKDSYVDDVCDYSDVVKAAFINVVTSGRDNDNLFTTKVVVPVGEAYLLAGEAKVELDAPAYISAAGYTMLPVRAISKALGVNTNNVLWNAETRTVTIMYAQRIITMTVGQKTIYVNGSAIPSSAAPEIKDGRTFLPLRDLGTALGVTNVNWDAATKTATLN